MAKKKSKSASNVEYLWPTPILSKRFNEYQRVNPKLVELFYAHRDKERRAPASSYASADDLLKQYEHNADLQDLAQFIKNGVYEIASTVNAPYWRQGDEINLYLSGLWFQISNGYAFHETHIHGNCSWSGVYYVQSGQSSKSAEEYRDTKPNGITRFYGPYMDFGAGGHGEYGNIYLQDASWDSCPQDGKLVIFPSWMKHMVFPYNGEDDRIIVSFHARLSNAKGDYWPYSFN